jgi:hypothetical protein
VKISLFNIIIDFVLFSLFRRPVRSRFADEEGLEGAGRVVPPEALAVAVPDLEAVLLLAVFVPKEVEEDEDHLKLCLQFSAHFLFVNNILNCGSIRGRTLCKRALRIRVRLYSTEPKLKSSTLSLSLTSFYTGHNLPRALFPGCPVSQ